MPGLETIADIQHGVVQPGEGIDVVGISAALQRAVAGTNPTSSSLACSVPWRSSMLASRITPVKPIRQRQVTDHHSPIDAHGNSDMYLLVRQNGVRFHPSHKEDLQLFAGTQLLRQFEQLRKVILALFLRVGGLSHFEIDGVDRIPRRFLALGAVL